MNKEVVINNFKKSLKNLSLEADDQIAAFPDFVVVTDELLLDFDHWYTLLKENFLYFFSSDEIKILDELNQYFDTIPAEDLNITETDELKNSPFWKQLRILAKDALSKLEH